MANVSGNFVAEWFGHRVYPAVQSSPQALADQRAKKCPFLSSAQGGERECVKAANARGVCTISSESNHKRQDWLVCPNRVVESALLDDVIGQLFGVTTGKVPQHVAAPRLTDLETRRALERAIAKGERPVVYLRDKLGGEISLSRTEGSPELSFDITLAELESKDGVLDVARYGVLEIQTMDFHGTYKHAVKNLEDALRLHKGHFARQVAKQPEWLSDHVEGPNISNVFKRTFYQLMLKFRLSRAPGCVGTVLAVPEAVWDSWQRHLANPALGNRDSRTVTLLAPGADIKNEGESWIYVFGLDPSSGRTPEDVQITKRILTTASSLSHFALQVAADEALKPGGPAFMIPEAIRSRLRSLWPAIAPIRSAPRRRR